jgi:hypothetical protein
VGGSIIVTPPYEFPFCLFTPGTIGRDEVEMVTFTIFRVGLKANKVKEHLF